MENVLFAFFASLVISFIAATTRGDGENILTKVIIGTILGTSVLLVYDFIFR